MADKTVTGIGARTGTFTLATPRAYAPLSASGYSIELRDKNGNLKNFLTPYVSKVNWEWNRIGGCGACNLTIQKPYRDIEFDARDDVQIRVKATESTDNLTNGGFENWDNCVVNSGFDSWTGATIDTWSVSGTCEKESSILRKGSYSARIGKTADWYIRQDISTAKGISYWKGKTVTFTCWVYTTVVGGAKILIYNMNGLSGGQDHAYSTETGWSKISVSRTIPDTADAVVILCAQNSTESYAYFDDAEVIDTPTGWTLAGAGAIVDRESTIKYGGNYSVKLTRNGTDCVVYQDIASSKGVSFFQNKTVTFGCWVYATSANKVALTINDNTTSDQSSYHSGNSSWEYLAVKHRFSSDATYARLQIYVVGDATVYFDGAVSISTYPISKLVYRGYIANATPTLSNDESIQVQVRGYFDLLKKIVVQSAGDTKTYTNKEVSVIVNSIADTFITPNTPISKSTIDTGSFTCDSIKFLTTVDDALNTLSDLSGDIEYGVDEYLRFFWRTESTTIRKRFFVGNNVEMLERKVNYDTLVNRAYLVGGEVAGVKYKRTAENTDSQSQYYLSEKIVNNGSIVTGTVADQYLGSILTENAQPQLAIRAKIANTDIRLEDIVPIGLIEFYDVDYDRDLTTDDMGDIIGETADGGSNITIGLTADGGDDIVIGGQFSAQIDRIQYEPSNTDNRMNLTIQFGDTVLETAAILKRLDLALSNLQQY